MDNFANKLSDSGLFISEKCHYMYVNAEYAHEMTARNRLRSMVERMYQQVTVVARPAYPKVYSMGLSIIKPQVQNMAWEETKEEIETSHIGLL